MDRIAKNVSPRYFKNSSLASAQVNINTKTEGRSRSIIKLVIFMSEAEMNSYRFGRGEEPSDEMHAQIVKEAAEDAKARFDKALKKLFEDLSDGMTEQEQKWADRINRIENGTQES